MGNWWRDWMPQSLGGDPKNYQPADQRKADVKECSAWSNKELAKQGIWAIGDAWNRDPRADKNFTKTGIVNGFSYAKKYRPKEFDRSDYDDYLAHAADSLQKYIDPAALKAGDVVSMYYKGSPNAKTAFDKGRNASSTHTGHIVIEDGKPYVMHNVSGTIHKNLLEDILGSGRNWGVTQVMRFHKSTPSKKKSGNNKIAKKEGGGIINVDSIYNANRNVPFINRIINKDSNYIDTGNGVATHKMGYATTDRGAVV